MIKTSPWEITGEITARLEDLEDTHVSGECSLQFFCDLPSQYTLSEDGNASRPRNLGKARL
jgi:hypothetical protein